MATNDDRSISYIILSVLGGIIIGVFTKLLLSIFNLSKFEPYTSVIITIISICIAVIVVRRVGRYRSIRVTLSITHTIFFPIISYIFLQLTMPVIHFGL